MHLEVKASELQKIKLFVATPMYGGQCAGMYSKAAIDLATMCANYGVECRFFFIFNESLITRARNYLVDEFLRAEEFTHLMFIDSDINFNPKYFERMIHHEIFHMIQNSYKNDFNDQKFSLFNNSDFEYAECSTCSDRLNLDLYENTKGFLTEYSKSIPSEDMAEIFSFLMVNKNLIEEKIKNDPILNNKVNFIKLNISKIDENIL